MTRPFAILTATALLLWSLPARAELDLTPVEKWVARASKIKTLTAEFRQEKILRTMKKPLETKGRLWYSQTANAFRWETGDPPRVIAALKPGGEELTVLKTEKKEAQVLSKKALSKDRMGQGLELLQAGFPTSMQSFQEKFAILAITPDQGWHRVELKPTVTMGGAVIKVMLMLNTKTNQMDAMHVYFRDGSILSNVLTATKENVAIPPAQFAPDLTGYTVKQK